jgi:DNA polymerase V
MQISDFIFPTENPPSAKRLLFPIGVPAGFPSPAQDYIAKRIDLNELLVKHPSSTFYVRADGDSMFPEICNGDLLIVDRNEEVVNGSTVLACIDNEFCVKKFYKRSDGSIELLSVNPDYKPVNLPDDCTFEVWAKVTAAIKTDQFK